MDTFLSFRWCWQGFNIYFGSAWCTFFDKFSVYRQCWTESALNVRYISLSWSSKAYIHANDIAVIYFCSCGPCAFLKQISHTEIWGWYTKPLVVNVQMIVSCVVVIHKAYVAQKIHWFDSTTISTQDTDILLCQAGTPNPFGLSKYLNFWIIHSGVKSLGFNENEDTKKRDDDDDNELYLFI